MDCDRSGTRSVGEQVRSFVGWLVPNAFPLLLRLESPHLSKTILDVSEFLGARVLFDGLSRPFGVENARCVQGNRLRTDFFHLLKRLGESAGDLCRCGMVARRRSVSRSDLARLLREGGGCRCGCHSCSHRRVCVCGVVCCRFVVGLCLRVSRAGEIRAVGLWR